jgi:hypothetical protein
MGDRLSSDEHRNILAVCTRDVMKSVLSLSMESVCGPALAAAAVAAAATPIICDWPTPPHASPSFNHGVNAESMQWLCWAPSELLLPSPLLPLAYVEVAAACMDTAAEAMAPHPPSLLAGVAGVLARQDGIAATAVGGHAEGACTQTLPPRLLAFPLFSRLVGRIARCLRLPAGHALLLGARGTGRRTAARAAAFALRCTLFEVCATQTPVYGSDQWRADLRKAVSAAAASPAPVVLLVDAGLLEAVPGALADVSLLVSSGEEEEGVCVCVRAPSISC